MNGVTVRELHEVIGGRLSSAPAVRSTVDAMTVARVVTDSRKVRAGDVFWGLVGRQADGADFAPDAFARGAAGVVAGRFVDVPPGCWAVQVDDALAALHSLAAWRRRQFQGEVVGVTGSVGKTTTRQMIHAVLDQRLNGCASPHNYNNHVGLPLSLLAVDDDHDYVVLELAANQRGEIGELARLAAPRIGVVTRIADAHLGSFGSVESIAAEKMELVRALPSVGWAVLADDVLLRKMARGIRARTVWVGRNAESDVRATEVRWRNGILEMRVDGRRLRVPVWGRHHLGSALAAIAVGRVLGYSMEEIARGLEGFQPPPMRCQVQRVGRATIINDAYNASPAAMRAALELLRDFETGGRKIAVVGDMRELGPAAPVLHRRIGREVVTRSGADVLLACGQFADEVVAGAREAGMPRAKSVACRTLDETVPRLQAEMAAGDVALVKGSRALAMEQLVAALADQPALRRAA